MQQASPVAHVRIVESTQHLIHLRGEGPDRVNIYVESGPLDVHIDRPSSESDRWTFVETNLAEFFQWTNRYIQDGQFATEHSAAGDGIAVMLGGEELDRMSLRSLAA